MRTDPDRQPNAYLTPDEFLDAKWIVARVPASLRDELRNKQPRVGARIGSDVLLRHAREFFTMVQVPLLPSVAENEANDGVGRDGNLTQHWIGFRDGIFAELADRADATERLWTQTFEISPLAQTVTGRALLAQQSFVEFEKLTQAAALSASAAKMSAEATRASADAAQRSATMAEAAEGRANASKAAEERAEKRSRWAVGWAAVAGVAAVAAVLVPLLLPQPAPIVDLRPLAPELARLVRAQQTARAAVAPRAGGPPGRSLAALDGGAN